MNIIKQFNDRSENVENQLQFCIARKIQKPTYGKCKHGVWCDFHNFTGRTQWMWRKEWL